MTTKRLGLACVLLAGCGSGGYEAVSGTVTVRGSPLEAGTIQFYTAGEPPVPAGGAMIRGGRYELPRQHGLTAGEYRVRISSTELVNTTKGDPASLDVPFLAVERIPAKYNSASTIIVTVRAGERACFDFDID